MGDLTLPVIPAKAGIPLFLLTLFQKESGIPAFAGMTKGGAS
jgi:hypothetical protein